MFQSYFLDLNLFLLILGSSGPPIPNNRTQKCGLKDGKIPCCSFSLLAKQKRTMNWQVKLDTSKLLKNLIFPPGKKLKRTKNIYFLFRRLQWATLATNVQWKHWILASASSFCRGRKSAETQSSRELKQDDSTKNKKR